MELLITPQELAGDAACVVFDCRYSLSDADAGWRDYEAGHIPGARYADLEKDLSSIGGEGGRHPLPDRSELVERLKTWGVDNDARVVCYDQNAGAFAGRLWWLVRWLGHENVAVLDGGLDAWLAAGYAVDTDVANPSPGDFTAREALTRSCNADALPDSGVKLLDARDAARFRGENEPIDPVAGHIPGAICAPFTDNLHEGRFKSPGALKARFRELAIDDETEAVCYCGSGVTATHNILALLLAGFPEPVLYAGSWSDWITDPSRPIETA